MMTTPEVQAYDQPVDLDAVRAGRYRTLFCVSDIETLINRDLTDAMLSLSAVHALTNLACPPANPANIGQLLIGSPVLGFDGIMELNPYAAWTDWLDDYICQRVHMGDGRADVQLDFRHLNGLMTDAHSEGMIHGRRLPIDIYEPLFFGGFTTPLDGWCDLLKTVADMTVQPYYSAPPSSLANMLARGLIGSRHPASPDTIAVVGGRWDQLDIRVFGPAASTV